MARINMEFTLMGGIRIVCSREPREENQKSIPRPNLAGSEPSTSERESFKADADRAGRASANQPKSLRRRRRSPRPEGRRGAIRQREIAARPLFHAITMAGTTK